VRGVRGDRIVDGRHQALVATIDEPLERVLRTSVRGPADHDGRESKCKGEILYMSG
jgi:hypothetical protein